MTNDFRATFDAVDAEAILAVRIPQNVTIVRIAWVHSSNGQYSVKSGYHSWQKHHMSDGNVQQSEGWAKIWRLCIPHKMRILLWRICRNNVPIRILLRGKGVNLPISCAMCVGEIEHLMHLFLDCPFAVSCWQKAGLLYDTRLVKSAPEWLLDKLCTESSDNLIKIATVLWGVWWARNKCVWEHKAITPEVAVAWSSKQISDWREAHRRKAHKCKQDLKPVESQTLRWVHPPPSTYKINVDASVFEGVNHFSIGLVLRDHLGQIIRGRVRKFAGHVSVFEAELVGNLETLRWSSTLSDHTIAVESDSQLSVKAINLKLHNHLEVGDLVEQCRLIIRHQTGVSVGFVKKQANRVAHVLARIPCTLNSFIDLLAPPLCVLETLLSDV